MHVIRPSRLVAPFIQEQGGVTTLSVSTFATFEPNPLFPTSGVFRASLASFAKF